MVSATALFAAQARRDLANKQKKTPPPPKDPQHKKKKKRASTEPIAVEAPSPKRSKGNEDRAVIPLDSDHGDQQSSPLELEDIPRDDQPLDLPEGSADCDTRLSRVFSSLSSAREEERIRSLGEKQKDNLLDSWLDFSLRLKVLTEEHLSSSSKEVKELKSQLKAMKTEKNKALRDRDEALEQLKAAEAKAKEAENKIAATEEKLLKSSNDLANLEASKATMQADLDKAKREANEHKSQRDSAQRMYKEMLQKYEDIQSDYEGVAQRHEDLLKAIKDPEASQIEKWKQSQAGEDYAAQVGLESCKIGENEAVHRFKEILSSRIEINWEEINAQYDKMVEEEKARALAELEKAEEDESDDDSSDDSSSSSSSDDSEDDGSKRTSGEDEEKVPSTPEDKTDNVDIGS